MSLDQGRGRPAASRPRGHQRRRVVVDAIPLWVLGPRSHAVSARVLAVALELALSANGAGSWLHTHISQAWPCSKRVTGAYTDGRPGPALGAGSMAMKSSGIELESLIARSRRSVDRRCGSNTEPELPFCQRGSFVNARDRSAVSKVRTTLMALSGSVAVQRRKFQRKFRVPHSFIKAQIRTLRYPRA